MNTTSSTRVGVETGSQRPTRRPWPLRAYIVGLVVVFAAAVGATTVYERGAAAQDARQAAARDAGFGAGLAVREITDALDLVRATVARTAANPSIAQVFAAPAGCTLNFGGAGPFGTGHLDIVASDGSVACSSLRSPVSPGYDGADWRAGALLQPTLAGPLVDARTGKQVVVVTAPIQGKGAMAAFLDLESLGPGLAANLGGPRRLEFLVTSPDGKTALTRSLGPTRWAGASLTGTPFARASDPVDRPDVTGVRRLYGEAAVPELGWKVHAGADRAEALAAVERLARRELSISAVGLLVFLLAAWVIHRRIARPIQRLSAGVRAATTHTEAGPLVVAGPAEVAALAEDFERLLAAAKRELETVSRLAAIVESSPDAIIGSTLDGEITSWNTGAERIYGYTVEEAVGRHVSMLVPPDRAEELTADLERIVRAEPVTDHETQGLRKEGGVIDVSVSVSPVYDASGMLAGISATVRDLTDAKRAEAERRTLEDRLHQSQRLESLGQLAGGIAHDFNNLLGVIINYADFAAEQTVDHDVARADIEQIRSAAERAVRLTRQLLIVGRRETAQPETLDLNSVVADIETLLARSIGEHVELVVRPSADPLPIRADRGQVEQVLLNLAVNARDAMPGGGTLTMETQLTDLDEDRTRLHPEVGPGRYVELSVSDTGMGMSPDVVAHIFEPFFTTKPKGEGTGLGLATLYGIVTEAGGGVGVYSEEGIGTTFRVYLPAVGAAVPVPVVEGVEKAAVGGRGETILVVEDEPAMLEVTSRMLRRNGYVVLEATSWEEALAHAGDSDVSLLLTDSVMPQMSGRDLAARVREVRPRAAVLFMSGYSHGVLGPRRVVDEGAMLIQKPFNETALLDKVRAALTTPGT